MHDLQSSNEFLFYNDGDESETIKVYVEDENTWVTQASMAEIFDIDTSGITRHLKNIFDSGELVQKGNVQKMHIAKSTKPVSFYSLDVIISVGYRINSRKATQFRIWATSVLKQYMLKGFALDDDRLKQGKQLFGKDYFDELIERIRDIRASERRFYQKVTEIYIQCSYDYDKKSSVTQQFFAHAQNKLEYAIVGMTAAEIINARANCRLPYMGLTSWVNQKSGGKVRKADTIIAKNYLEESEISRLNRLVNMFLDYAENLAEKGKKMSMHDWQEKLDVFLKFNEYEILRDYGSIKKSVADDKASLEFKAFKPIQNAQYRSDFDKAVEHIKSTGRLPKEEIKHLKVGITGFDKKLKKALDYTPKKEKN